MNTIAIFIPLICFLALKTAMAEYLLVELEESQGLIIPEPVPEPIDTKQAADTFVKLPTQGPIIPEPVPEIERVSTEVCCKKAGVPLMCMGLCMDPMGPASRKFPSWTSACAQHEQAIENCFAPVETKTPIIPEPKLEPKPISPEVCCKNGGVPQMCMGLCMDPKGPASRNLPKSWVNACEQHEQTIEKCFTSGTSQGPNPLLAAKDSKSKDFCVCISGVCCNLIYCRKC